MAFLIFNSLKQSLTFRNCKQKARNSSRPFYPIIFVTQSCLIKLVVNGMLWMICLATKLFSSDFEQFVMAQSRESLASSGGQTRSHRLIAHPHRYDSISHQVSYLVLGLEKDQANGRCSKKIVKAKRKPTPA